MHTFDQFIDVIWCNIYTIALERSRSNLDDGLDEYQVFDQALWRNYWRFLLFFKQTKKINYFPFFFVRTFKKYNRCKPGHVR